MVTTVSVAVLRSESLSPASNSDDRRSRLQQAVNEDPVLHDVFATMTYLAKESYTSQECDQM